jgi:hypothetical protein
VRLQALEGNGVAGGVDGIGAGTGGDSFGWRGGGLGRRGGGRGRGRVGQGRGSLLGASGREQNQKQKRNYKTQADRPCIQESNEGDATTQELQCWGLP